jgi:signal transduction histidine kinase
MRLNIAWILPKRISGQIAVLILLSMIAIHAVITASLLWSHRHVEPEARGHLEIPAIVRTLAAVPQAERAQFIAHFAKAFPALEIRSIDANAANSISSDAQLKRLREILGPGLDIKIIADDGERRLTVRFRDGDFISFKMAGDPFPPFFSGPVMITVLFMGISITLLAFWATRSLTRPLTSFAKAAEGFSPDQEVASLPESGPTEIRSAAKALNQMQQRINELVDDRTRMLAAMGHDLRTPITRLRLRSELIAERPLREKILHDLDQMKTMIDAALSYLRDGKSREAIEPVDIAVLLQTVCDQFADVGHDAVYLGPDHLTICVQPDAMQRAIGNLVHNAIRYGGKARVSMQSMPVIVRIQVEDDGPGISDGDKATVLEPFTRGDAARNMNDTGGFGLGLAIARAVVMAHGGTLTLHDRDPHGLIARIELNTLRALAA